VNVSSFYPNILVLSRLKACLQSGHLP